LTLSRCLPILIIVRWSKTRTPCTLALSLLLGLCAGYGCDVKLPWEETDWSSNVAVDTTPAPTDLPDVGSDSEAGPGDSTAFGKLVGIFELVYYWQVHEEDHPGPPEVELVRVDKSVIATVSEGFASALVMEGTGKLKDGRLVTLHTTCNFSATAWCFIEGDPDAEPYGLGSEGPLRPFRSIALGVAWGLQGQVVYVPDVDGVQVPAAGGTAKHDGCLLVNDTGWSLGPQLLDLYVLHHDHAEYLYGVFPDDYSVDLFSESPFCPASANDLGEFFPLP